MEASSLMDMVETQRAFIEFGGTAPIA